MPSKLEIKLPKIAHSPTLFFAECKMRPLRVRVPGKGGWSTFTDEMPAGQHKLEPTSLLPCAGRLVSLESSQRQVRGKGGKGARDSFRVAVRVMS